MQKQQSVKVGFLLPQAVLGITFLKTHTHTYIKHTHTKKTVNGVSQCHVVFYGKKSGMQGMDGLLKHK